MQAEPLRGKEQITGHVALLALALSAVWDFKVLLLLPAHWQNRVGFGSPPRQISPELCHQDQLEIYPDAALHKIYGQAQNLCH